VKRSEGWKVREEEGYNQLVRKLVARGKEKDGRVEAEIQKYSRQILS